MDGFHQVWFEALSIIIGGAVLGVTGYILNYMIKFLKKLDHTIDRVDDHEQRIINIETYNPPSHFRKKVPVEYRK